MGLLDSLTGIAKSAETAGTAWVQEKLGSYSSTFGGIPSSFNNDPIGLGGAYEVSQHTYPSDLFSSEHVYGGNYVVFYINVAEDSKLVASSPESTVGINVNERLRSTIAQAGLSSDLIAATQATLGGLAGTAFGSLFGAAGSGGIIGAATGGVASKLVSAVTGGKMSRQQKRLKTAIAMNVPNSLNIRYSANWDPIETAGYQALAGTLSAGGDKAMQEAQKGNFGSIQNAIKSAVSSGGAGAAAGAGASAPYVAGQAASGNVLSAASGLAPNPKKEQVFSGVDFRTFTFEYQFSPRDADESKKVLNIINTFKLHMHPEFKDESSYLFVYPSEFDIHYYYYTQENKSIHKHTSCVLSDMSVNYTPNGNFNTFEDGTPTQIDVQMTFKELAILTKTQIEQGF